MPRRRFFLHENKLTQNKLVSFKGESRNEKITSYRIFWLLVLKSMTNNLFSDPRKWNVPKEADEPFNANLVDPSLSKSRLRSVVNVVDPELPVILNLNLDYRKWNLRYFLFDQSMRAAAPTPMPTTSPTFIFCWRQKSCEWRELKVRVKKISFLRVRSDVVVVFVYVVADVDVDTGCELCHRLSPRRFRRQ